MIRHPQASRRTVAPLAFVLFLAVTLGLGAAAQALEFTVTLKNGTTFETRYRPVQAEWDENMTMFLNDRGNWIAVENNAIADVVSKAEESGFGIRLDTTTLLLGDSPGFDLTETGEDAGGGAAGGDFELPAASSPRPSPERRPLPPAPSPFRAISAKRIEAFPGVKPG